MDTGYSLILNRAGTECPPLALDRHPHKRHIGLWYYWLLDRARRQVEYIDQRKMMPEPCRVRERDQACDLHLVEAKANRVAKLSDLRSPWIDRDTEKRWGPMANLEELAPSDSKIIRARIALPAIKGKRVMVGTSRRRPLFRRSGR